MKIAINLRGISHGHGRNWNFCKNSIKENVIDCWAHLYNLYVTTYNHSEIYDLLEFYNPYKYQILEFNEKSNQIETFEKSLQIIDNDFDLIIITRFDIDFSTKISKFNINYEKINFLFKEGTDIYLENPFVCDNIFFIPKKFWGAFKKCIYEIEDKNSTHLHFLYIELLKNMPLENFNFIFQNVKSYSHDNSIYKLVRNKFDNIGGFYGKF